MLVEKMKPVRSIDWERVNYVRVTLEEPYGKGLHFRMGSTAPKKNLSYSANDDASGPPFWPGQPIMYPEEGPCQVGESFVMPKDSALTAFGYYYAPVEVTKNGLQGFTVTEERQRVAAFWGWYRMPKGDGTMHPPMNRLGPPPIPHVALRPLDRNFQPLLVDGEEVVIRPWDFFDFANPGLYDELPGERVATIEKMVATLSDEEVAALRAMLKGQHGKAKSA